MRILTLKIDENSKKGKALIDFLIAFYSEERDVQILEINADSEVKSVAESGVKYKTYLKAQKDTNNTDSEESPYNPEFVKMVLDAEKRAEYTTLDPNDVWGSLKLK